MLFWFGTLDLAAMHIFIYRALGCAVVLTLVWSPVVIALCSVCDLAMMHRNSYWLVGFALSHHSLFGSLFLCVFVLCLNSHVATLYSQ